MPFRQDEKKGKRETPAVGLPVPERLSIVPGRAS